MRTLYKAEISRPDQLYGTMVNPHYVYYPEKIMRPNFNPVRLHHELQKSYRKRQRNIKRYQKVMTMGGAEGCRR